MKSRFLAFVGTLSIVFCFGCAETVTTRTTEYTSGGSVQEQRVEVNGQLRSELRRIFENTTLRGEGIIENSNEGLARRAAISLAVAELARKTQEEVRANTVIYQNSDVRDVVETNVHSLVSNYEIDSAGYDPGTNKYRVTVSIRGEQLIREIEKRIAR